jgi:hypothetical protein
LNRKGCKTRRSSSYYNTGRAGTKGKGIGPEVVEASVKYHGTRPWHLTFNEKRPTANSGPCKTIVVFWEEATSDRFFHELTQRRPFLVQTFVFDLLQLALGDIEFLGDDLVGFTNVVNHILGSYQGL